MGLGSGPTVDSGRDCHHRIPDIADF